MFTESEISKFYVSLFVQQNVVRFQISMDVVVLVDRFNCTDGLSDVESRLLLSQNVLAHEKCHEIAATEELHYEIEIVTVLERLL